MNFDRLVSTMVMVAFAATGFFMIKNGCDKFTGELAVSGGIVLIIFNIVLEIVERRKKNSKIQ